MSIGRLAFLPGHQLIPPHAWITRRRRDQPGVIGELLLDPFSLSFQEVAQAALFTFPAQGSGVFTIPGAIPVGSTAADRTGRHSLRIGSSQSTGLQVLAHGFDGFAVRRAARALLVLADFVEAGVACLAQIDQVLVPLDGY